MSTEQSTQEAFVVRGSPWEKDVGKQVRKLPVYDPLDACDEEGKTRVSRHEGELPAAPLAHSPLLVLGQVQVQVQDQGPLFASVRTATPELGFDLVSACARVLGLGLFDYEDSPQSRCCSPVVEMERMVEVRLGWAPLFRSREAAEW